MLAGHLQREALAGGNAPPGPKPCRLHARQGLGKRHQGGAPAICPNHPDQSRLLAWHRRVRGHRRRWHAGCVSGNEHRHGQRRVVGAVRALSDAIVLIAEGQAIGV